jgi:hypothetical protein
MSSLPRHCNQLILIIFVIVTLSLPGTTANAAPAMQDIDCSKLSPVTWQEMKTAVFAYLYPIEYDDVVSQFLDKYGSRLELDYAIFTRLYQTNLSLPITIRIYPSLEDYFCLNIMAPQVAVGETHSRIGMREIAIFGDRILADITQWELEALNIFRFELGVLFVDHISNTKAPPGLLGGAGVYMMDPAEIFEEREISGSGIGKPDVTWRFLWENGSSLISPGDRLQAVSTVAYLVEGYGWAKFLQFLKDLPTSEGYRQSLTQIYGVDFSALQREWEKYYPLYYQGRWRVHVLYDFDLTPYEKMVAGGAYTDAVLGLKDVITFLEQNEQLDKLAEAKVLQEQAKTGQNASALVLQARQALQNKEYEKSTQLADQAQAIFDQLGDRRRINELDSYRIWVKEVLTLQAEMDKLKKELSDGGDPVISFDRMIVVSQRLFELGETQARDEVLSYIREYDQVLQIQRQQFYAGVLLVPILLITIRILLMRFKPPREATI